MAAVNRAGASALATSFDVQTQDQPPTVNAPTAAANPVTGTSTTLSVVATDDGGAGNLTYSWSGLQGSGPGGTLSFSNNDSSDASSTTVTFPNYGNGDWILQVTVTDALGMSASSSLRVVVSQILSTFEVTPSENSVLQGQSCQLVAEGLDQFGDEMATMPPINWSTTSGADSRVTPGGLYVAPSTPGSNGTYSVTASVAGMSSTANVVVVPCIGLDDIDFQGYGVGTQCTNQYPLAAFSTTDRDEPVIAPTSIPASFKA